MLKIQISGPIPRDSIPFESESEVAQSCPTLCDPMDCSLPGSSVHGIFQAIVLEWIAILVPRNLHFSKPLPKNTLDRSGSQSRLCETLVQHFDTKIQGEMHGQVLRRVAMGIARKFRLFAAVQVFFYCFQLWVEINYHLFPNTLVLKSFHQSLKSPMPPASS